MNQLFILLFGATAVWLSQDKRTSYRKWASVFGLIGQPFWFYSAYNAQQWGVFCICILYTISWGRGFYNNWWTS